MIVHQTIPNWNFGFGKCVRHTTCLYPDGSRIPSTTDEWFFTIKLPWKRRIYSVSVDDMVSANRFVMRFKWGWIS